MQFRNQDLDKNNRNQSAIVTWWLGNLVQDERKLNDSVGSSAFSSQWPRHAWSGK